MSNFGFNPFGSVDKKENEVVRYKAPDSAFNRAMDRIRENISANMQGVLDKTGVEEFFYISDSGQEIVPAVFRELVPEEHKAYWNCNCCISFLKRASRLWVMVDGKFVNYVSKFFKEEFPQLQQIIENIVGKPIRNPKVRPLVKLSDSLLKPEAGGFEHLYLIPEERRGEYEDTKRPYNNMKQVEKVHAVLESLKGLGTDNMETLLGLLKKTVTKPEVLKGFELFIGFVKDYREAPINQMYDPVHALLCLEDNSFMDHLFGSISGVVIEALENFNDDSYAAGPDLIFKQCLNRINFYAHGSTYKVRTSPISNTAIDEAVKWMVENNVENALKRQVLLASEVKDVFWYKTPVENKSPNDLLEAANKLKKTPGSISQGVELPNRNISFTEFKKLIAEEKPVRIEMALNAPLKPISLTAPEIEGDYSRIFKKPKSFDDWIFILTTVEPLHPANAAAMVTDLNLNRIEVDYMVDNEATFFFGVNKVAASFNKMMKEFGSLVRGTHITSEAYGFSNAIVKLSESMKLKDAETVDAAGGFGLTFGQRLFLHKANGSVEVVTILTN